MQLKVQRLKFLILLSTSEVTRGPLVLPMVLGLSSSPPVSYGISYCSPIWDCLSGYLSDKLLKLQNREARVITKSPFIIINTSSNHLLSPLDWERLSLRRKKQKALMMYKTMNDLVPEYLQSLFSQRHSAYNLRNSEGRLTLSKPSTNYLI